MRVIFIIAVIASATCTSLLPGLAQEPEGAIGAYVAVLTEIDASAKLFIGPRSADPTGFPSKAFFEKLLPFLHERGIEAAYCRPGCLRGNDSARNIRVVLSEAVLGDGGYWITVSRWGSFGSHPLAGWVIDERFLVVERDGRWQVERKESLRIS